MKIYAYQLKSNLSDIETVTNVKFKKSLEKTYIAQNENSYIFYSLFNSIAFAGYELDEVEKYAQMLGANVESLQDFEIIIDAKQANDFAIKDSKLFLKTDSIEHISIAALIVMQSVSLDFYETKLDCSLEDSKKLFDGNKNIFLKSNKLIKLVSSSAILRHELISDLRLLDKPLIVWDDDICDLLYDNLSAFFELRDRFNIIEYKIAQLKDDLVFLLDVEQHKKTIILEWIIIILITFEVIIGIIKY